MNTRAQAATPGQGNYTLHGVVRSRAGCAPVAGAKIEYWPGDAQAAGQPGQRAALQADSQGAYQLHCSPPAEAGRQDYIYLRVSADGFAPVLTQYRPKAGQVEDWLDIVLEPAG